MIFSKLLGTGSALPPRYVSNQALVEELATRGIESSSDWIEARTGIRQRYLADPSMSSSQLGLQAAKRALDMAALKAEDIDLIIVATSTPDVIFPSTACLIQQALGCKGAAAFDVQAVCAGFVYGVSTADAMIRTGMARRALVIGAEVFSRILDWNDRGTCVLLVTAPVQLFFRLPIHPVFMPVPCMPTAVWSLFCKQLVRYAAGWFAVTPFSPWMARRFSRLPSTCLTRSPERFAPKQT